MHHCIIFISVLQRLQFIALLLYVFKCPCDARKLMRYCITAMSRLHRLHANALLSYYLFLFTPLILSVDDKYLIGWVFVGIICIMLVANLVAMLLNVFKDLVKRIKLWFV